MEKSKSSTAAKKWAIIGFAAILFLAVAYMPVPESFLTQGGNTLTPLGRLSLGVLFFGLVLWMTEAIPFHITGLLCMIMLAVFRAESFTELVRLGFGNETVAFFIGVLILSACITKSGVGGRIALLILSKTGNDTRKILLGFMTGTTLISFWMTSVAVAAMVTPLAKSILEEEGVVPLKSNFGRCMMIGCVWATLIGGIATPAGSGANPLALGFLQEMTGIRVTFLEWMIYGVPSALLMIVPAWFILIVMFRPEMTHLSKTKEAMVADYKNLPAISKNEKATIAIFLLTVFLWLSATFWEDLLGTPISTSMIAIFTSLLFFFPGVCEMKWRDIEADIPWGGIILILTGISLGMVVFSTGAAMWLSVILLGGIVGMHPILQIFMVVMMASVIKVGFSSISVTATVVVPILISMAQSFDIPVLQIVLPASITLSLAFIMVTSSPSNVIPYSAGYFSIGDLVKSGIIMTIITSAIFAVTMYGIGRLTGLY